MLIRTHSAADLRRLMVELQLGKALRIKTGSLIVDVDPVSLG
jgi:hypothetical protein